MELDAGIAHKAHIFQSDDSRFGSFAANRDRTPSDKNQQGPFSRSADRSGDDGDDDHSANSSL